jgi:Na+-transporting NADH:ubiquinone oxidoreductase subunit A
MTFQGAYSHMGIEPETTEQSTIDTPAEHDLNLSPSVSRVALLGRDFRSGNFEFLCKEDDRVAAGSALMRDARRPAIVFTAPGAGRVARIERGQRRKLVSLQIDLDDTVGTTQYTPPAIQDKASLRAFMLESGAWPALCTRPFGNIPDPDSEPAAIFITAMDSEVQAPAPIPIINSYSEEFRAAANALAAISAATVYVCHSKGCSLPVDESDKLRSVSFADGHSAGLPGVHINALCPIGFGGGEVWHIGYQDVISLGHLLLHGEPWLERVISIAGTALQHPRRLRVSLGTSIGELLKDETFRGPVRFVSGSTLRGQAARGGEAYLGARHRQITVLAETGVHSPSSLRATTGGIIPTSELESLAPPGIYPVPLMRALQVGDVDRARDLGALELVEEDLALLSLACLSKCDYGLLLRKILNQLEGAG